MSVSKIAYWYCTNCHEEVDSSRVTWQELHDACGHHVEWIEGISIDRLREICAAERDGRLVVLDKKPLPVVRGEWKLYGNDDDLDMSYWCTVCNFHLSEELFYSGYKNGRWIENGVFKYCPNCGAKMEVEP
jgi:hypothetical protein